MPQPLKRELKNRHVQLIALGGAIGTGLFLGSASAIQLAGPAVLVAYAIGGFMAFLIMRQLGEMMAQEPVAGSFSNLAHTYWGDYPGFLSGWNYWGLYVLVSMSELTAVATYVHFWFPEIPKWQSVAFFFIIINIINLMAVKIFGEMEFWFSIIKVTAIIAMICLGSYLIFAGESHEHISISNLWQYGGFAPHGVTGILLALAIVMFSFGGLELVGIAAAETSDPQTTIPKAINQLVYRILIFYIGALTVLLCLYPWDKLANTVAKEQWGAYMAASPFVQIFSEIGIPSAAHVLNFVILTAALSVYNSSVFCNSRMLYGLALQKNAPALMARVNSQGTPIMAVLLSSGSTLFCVALNYFIPEKALSFIMSLVIIALLINWIMISLTHLKFRTAKEKSGETLIFKSLFFPFSNYLCVAFTCLILVILCFLGEWLALIMAPCWIVIVSLIYKAKKFKQQTKKQ